MCSMADRRPLVTPGKIAEIADGDRAIVSGIVRTAAGDLTFEDPVTGAKTLAQLAAGSGIGGSTGATDEALLRADGTGGSTAQASTITVSDAGLISGGLIGARLTPQVSHPGASDDDTLWWTTGGDLYIGNARIALAYEITEPTYITPTALAARADDYGPSGWNTATHVRQNVTGDQEISGFATAVVVGSVLPVKTKYLLNISTTNTLTLLHDSAFSSADNRIRCPGGVDFVMPPSSGVVIAQEPSPGPIWRVVSIGDTGGGGGIGGSTGANDNRVLRADGAGGATVQASPVTIDDAGAVTGVTSLTASGALSGSNLSGTNTGDQTITLTGDVTGSGTGSFAATIANDAVTYAKIQNVAADRLLGRGNGGGAGDVQEITLGTNLSMAAGVLNATSGAPSYTIISPASIGANQNNYSPASWSTADIVRLTGSGNYDITGFDATATTVRKLLWNVDTADTFTLKHESGSSTAANRIVCPYDLDMKLSPDGAIVIHYDATTARWRAVSDERRPPILLSQARRTAGALVASVSYIGFDSEVYPTLAEYLSFDSAGTWTVNKACTLLLRDTITWYAATSGVASIVMDFRKNAVTVLQEQCSSAEQATDNYTTQTIEVAHDFVAGDTIRLYLTNFGGSPTTVANMNIMSIFHVKG
jgi:hypothetical protein